tara:strand:+ start:4838 stop:6097 length:1260 start_codon:yes stop_codon:yes gene_type:complete
MFENLNYDPNNQLIHYKVNGKIFYSDFAALEYLTNTINRNQKNNQILNSNDNIQKYLSKKGVLEFCIRGQEMNSDWTQEPPHSIQYYRQKMCKAISSTYDDVILAYTGGTDTETILDTFKFLGTTNLSILNFANDFIHQQSKARQFLRDHTVHHFDKKHGADAKKLNWNVKMFQAWTPTDEKQFEDLITDYKIGHWLGDYKNVNGWWQNSGKTTLSMDRKGKKTCMVYGYEKPNIILKDGWWTYSTTNDTYDLPWSALDPNTSIIYFWINDLVPELIQKLAHLKAKELDKIICENNIEVTNKDIFDIGNTNSTNPYYVRLMNAMGFQALSGFLQGCETKKGGNWNTADAKEQKAMGHKTTKRKQHMVDNFFDEVVSKKLHPVFVDKEEKIIKRIWGKTIKVMKASEKAIALWKNTNISI